MEVTIYIHDMDLNPISDSDEKNPYLIKWGYIKKQVPHIINTQMWIYGIAPEQISMGDYSIQKSDNGENYATICSIITLHKDIDIYDFYRKHLLNEKNMFQLEFPLEFSNKIHYKNGLFLPQIPKEQEYNPKNIKKKG